MGLVPETSVTVADASAATSLIGTAPYPTSDQLGFDAEIPRTETP